METELQAIPGVADVQGVRTVRISIAGSSRILITTDMVKFFQHIKPEVFEGDIQQMARLVSQGQGVVISENFSTLENLHLHNWLEIPTPSGLLRLPIVGVIRDYASQKGSLLMDRAVFQRYWKSSELDVFRIYVQSSASADDVKRRILEDSRDRRELFVLTSRELKDYVLRSVDQWFGLTYLPVLIAILVALLGIANTLLVSVTDRRRELAILRAVGGLRRQVRRIVSAEALLIALIGLVIGIALGAGNLYYALEIARRQITGVGLSYQFPWKLALLLFPAILLAAWVSAVWPGLSAVRQPVVEALEYE
jgi:putative ABC transport system permease protein